MQVIVFLQTCINFVEQGLKFSHFEGSIIPLANLSTSVLTETSENRN